MKRLSLPMLAAAALGGCGGATVPPPVSAGTRPAVGFSLPPTVARGGETLMGRSASAVGDMFGKPRLDVTEGAGRKLQFAGDTCIIDVYFYAPKAGAKPVATHVDARRSDGGDADTNSCVTALKRR